jgi:arsenate reductase (thioredoxin)
MLWFLSNGKRRSEANRLVDKPRMAAAGRLGHYRGASSIIPPRNLQEAGANTVFNVLFLCCGSSARGVMAEAILNRFGGDRFHGFSACIAPKEKEEVDPLAIEVMRTHGLSTEGLRNRSWSEFHASSTPRIDFLISVCEDAPAELPASLPKTVVKAHWGITDPGAVKGGELERRNAVRRAFRELETRIKLFVLLRHESPARMVVPVPAPS